jgi:hypothetical protein
VHGAKVDDLAAPAVYVVLNTRWGAGDCSGSLLLSSGEGLWGHMSSSLGWLVRDLTIQFPDRREKLEALYPEGYMIVVADRAGIIPDEIIEKNKIWGEAREAAGDTS